MKKTAATPANQNFEQLKKITAFFPLLTISAYAQGTGLSVDTVRGHVRLGHLPSVKQGKYRFINMVALLQQAQDAAKDYSAKR